VKSLILLQYLLHPYVTQKTAMTTGCPGGPGAGTEGLAALA